MDVPEPGILVLDKERSTPAGDELLVRTTVLENPNREVTVIVEVHELPPAFKNKDVGLADTVKSGPFTVTNKSAVVVKAVLFPVTVTK